MYPSLTAPLDPSSLSLVVVASIGSRRSSFTVFGSGGKQGNAAWASTRNSAASMNCIAEVFKSFDEVRVVYFVQGLSKKEGRVVINEERIEGTELGALGRVLGVFEEV